MDIIPHPLYIVDTLEHIFSFLPSIAKIISGIVCREWHIIIYKPQFVKHLQMTADTKPNIELLNEGILYYPISVLEKMNFHVKFRYFICDRSAFYGKLEILKWALSQNCSCDDQTCSSAAKGGHLGVLKFLVENGCRFDEWTFSNAVEAGHTHIIKYLLENGCPYDEFWCSLVAKNKKVREYLHNVGCPINNSKK